MQVNQGIQNTLQLKNLSSKSVFRFLDSSAHFGGVEIDGAHIHAPQKGNLSQYAQHCSIMLNPLLLTRSKIVKANSDQ